MDDRNRRAPIALTADAPVAQPKLHLLVAQVLGFEVGRDGVDRRVVGQSVVLARIHTHAALFVRVPRPPRVGGERLAIHGDHLRNRQTVFLGEGEVALVVRRHAHHRAFAVGHQHVVADPDLDLGAGQRVRDVKAGGHALLVHRRHVGFHHRTLLALVDEGQQVGLVQRQPRGQRMLGGNGDEAHAHDGVGARRVHAQQLGLAVDRVREAKVDAEALADPVLLDQTNAVGPAGKAVQRALEQFLGVARDVEVVARDLALFHWRARTPAVAVDHLLVGQHGLVHRIPVDDLRLAVGDALLEHLQEEPLVPLVVGRVAACQLARPVDRQTQRLALALHHADVLVGPRCGGDLALHRGVFCRQAKGVPAHRHQDIEALHALVARKHVVDGVVAHMPHVQPAARVRQHRAGVELLFLRVLVHAIGVARVPMCAGCGLDLCRNVAFVHGRRL